MLIDSHCHLDYLERDQDLDAVVARAGRAGVGVMVTICTKLTEFDKVRAIAERYPQVYCTVGVHPHEAAQEGQRDPARLIALADHPRVIGIGETGLDYFYEHSPRGPQRESFRGHLRAALETGLPVIVHTRDADEETVALLREAHAEGPLTGVIHCFTAGPALARAALDMGLYISVSGIVTFGKAEDLRQTLREVPLERLLVETDSPYLAPVPKRGKPNEPAFVVHTAAALAELKGVSPEDLARITSENAYRLFAKAERPTETRPPA